MFGKHIRLDRKLYYLTHGQQRVTIEGYTSIFKMLDSGIP